MIKKITQYIFILSIGFPLLFLFVLSLGKNWVFPNLLPAQLSTNNWQIVHDTETNFLYLFLCSLILSVSVSVMVTAFSFIISKAIAYSKNKTTYLILAYIPYLLSPVIMAVLFHYFFIIADITGTLLGVIIARAKEMRCFCPPDN